MKLFNSHLWCWFQIWDFNSAQKIKDVPPEPLNNTMVYCCQWLGTDSIICGGHNHNMARIIDRGTLNVSIVHVFRSCLPIQLNS